MSEYKPKTNETQCTHICELCDSYFSHYIIYTEQCNITECENCLKIQEQYPELTSWILKIISNKFKNMIRNI